MKLTSFAKSAGCAGKLSPAALSAALNGIRRQTMSQVLVGFEHADDAGVYRLSEDLALVQTVDFFPPMVDDPYVFGQIAAANALSDVYAMGGVPRTALAIAALPKNGPTADEVRAIFQGGADVLRQAGVALLGGHTVTDPEVKFGYAITGEVDPARMLTNAGAREGDVLLLTKPLGTGIIVRARRFGHGSDEELAGAVASMVVLNDLPARVAASLPAGIVHACTDVTGFGLAGHACEVAAASGTTLVIEGGALPLLPGALRLAAEFLPCGGRSNQRHFEGFRAEMSAAPEVHLVCLDPQTSGGLLMAVDAGSAPHVIGRLTETGRGADVIGRVEARAADGTLVRLV